MFDNKPDVSQGINHLNGRWRMSATPAREPGRDNDPAPHARGRPDNTASAPSASSASSASSSPAGDASLPPSSLDGWVPLPASSVDWLDEAEWAASRAACEDEQEPVDPDLEDGPPDWEGLDAVIAEAREITAAEARDAEYAARMVAGGGFGLVGAAPGPRGPGQPGSAKSFPGEHASPAAAFGSGLALDTAPGCAVLAEFADAVAGEDDRYPGATDDEIIGLICAWSRTEAHAAARKLAAVAEFIRRRPAKDSAPNDPAENTAPDPAKAAAAKDRAPQDPAKAAATEDGAPPDPAKGAAAKGASQNPAKGGTAEDASKRSAAEDPAGPA